MKKVLSLLILFVLSLLSFTVHAEFQPLGIYAIRNEYNNIQDPKLANHLTLYNGQSVGYTLYGALYDDKNSYFKVDTTNPHYTSMSGKFTVLMYPTNSSGQPINKTIVVSTFNVAAKGTFGFYPESHTYSLDGQNLTNVPVNPNNLPSYEIFEILYRTSVAQIAAYKVSNGHVNSGTEYPNK